MVQNCSCYIKKINKKDFQVVTYLWPTLFVKCEIKKNYYWNCCLKPWQGFEPQIEPQNNQMTIPFNKLPWLPGVEYPRISGASLSLGAWSIIDWFPMEKFLFICAAIVAVSKGWGGYIELAVTGSGIDPWWSPINPRFPFPEISVLANCFLSLWACLSIGLDQVTSTRQSSRTSLSLVAS